MTRRERIDLAQSIKNQVDFILARSQPREGYAETYNTRSTPEALGILEADYQRLMLLIDETADLVTRTNQGVPEPVQGQAVRSVMGGEAVICAACGNGRFFSRGRSLDYHNWECAQCGKSTSTLTESGASR